MILGDPDKLKKVKRKELLENEMNALSMEAKVMHFNARYFKSIVENKGDGIKDLNQLLKYFEKNPKWIASKPGIYISTVNNMITYCIFSKEYKLALELVNKAKATYDQVLPSGENTTLMKQILRTYNVELEVYRDQHLYVDDPTHIKKTEKFVEKYQYKMPKEYLISFWFQLANIGFLQKDYKSGLKWVNEIIQMNFRNIREDIQIQARFLNLLIHFEQNNMFVLRYFVDHTRRFIKRRKKLEEHEMILLGFFSKLGRIPASEYQDAYRKLYDNLFSKSDEPLISQELLDYLDYGRWLKEKIKI